MWNIGLITEAMDVHKPDSDLGLDSKCQGISHLLKILKILKILNSEEKFATEAVQFTM